MAVPTYAEDLTDIDLAEATTNYVAIGGGGAGLSADIDFAIQGTNSITKQVSNARKGILFNNSSTITIPAGDHIYVWIYCTTPGLLDTLAVGGLCVSIGNTTSARNEFHIYGATEYAQGGWVCIPIEYVTTANGSHPYRTLVGTPSGSPQYFGVVADTTTTVKAVNTSVDAMRYGTGAYITAGELANPATFGGYATQNDNSSNRWGILTAIDGGYSLQGRFVVGQDNTQTPALGYFDDSNTLVVLADTFHSASDFTQIIVDHASSTFNLTNVTILALGTNNPGRLIFNNASTTSALTGCVFDSIGITTLRAGVTVDACTWRTTDLVTQNNAVIDNSIFSNITSSASILSDNPSDLDSCTFTSDGSNHAIEITTAGTYTLTDHIFNNYATSDGSTGNEVIYNNSGGAVTLNASGNTGTISVRNGTSATTSVVVTVTLTVTDVPSGVQMTIVNSSTRTELQNSTSTGVDITYSHEGGETVDILFMANDYDPNSGDVYDLVLPSINSSIKANISDDINYDNPV